MQRRHQRLSPPRGTLSAPPKNDALALLDVAPCGLLQTLEDGTIVRVNRTFCACIGYEPDELIGKVRLQALLSMGARIFHQTHWAPLMRMQGSVSEVKLDVMHRNGSAVPMVLNALLRNDDGVVVHEVAAFVARDRDNYERELLRTGQRLAELVAETTRLHAEARERAAAAEQMIAIVSHDLRNPLSTIAMGSAVLRRDPLSSQQERSVVLVERATRRASVLIGDLLDFAQARLGGGLRVTREAIDVHEVVAHALDELRSSVGEGRIVHASAGPPTCFADPNRIAQLVGNLVSNALTYGEPGSVVTVTSTVTDASCMLSVHNHGAPIADRVAASLFEPMTRGVAPDSTSRSIGLGLFIVQQIAQAHGGAVLVDSALGAGTEFRTTFPRDLVPHLAAAVAGG